MQTDTGAPSLPTDAQLIVASRDDPRAFRELYDRWAEPLIAYFYRRVLDPEVAADLLAETFAVAYQKRGRFRDIGRPGGAWLYGIAGKELARYFRRRTGRAAGGPAPRRAAPATGRRFDRQDRGTGRPRRPAHGAGRRAGSALAGAARGGGAARRRGARLRRDRRSPQLHGRAAPGAEPDDARRERNHLLLVERGRRRRHVRRRRGKRALSGRGLPRYLRAGRAGVARCPDGLARRVREVGPSESSSSRATAIPTSARSRACSRSTRAPTPGPRRPWTRSCGR